MDHNNYIPIDSTDSSLNETALHSVCEYGYTKIARLLIQNGSDVNVKNYMGVTPLHMAANSGFHEIVELLLQNGAYVHAKTFTYERSPLHYASTVEVAEMLLRYGANINAVDIDGMNSLHYALYLGDANTISLIRFFLQNGIEIKNVPHTNITVYDLAYQGGIPGIIEIIDEYNIPEIKEPEYQ